MKSLVNGENIVQGDGGIGMDEYDFCEKTVQEESDGNAKHMMAEAAKDIDKLIAMRAAAHPKLLK
eukprot:3029316-Alexandrium_andersonii.AAC.1